MTQCSGCERLRSPFCYLEDVTRLRLSRLHNPEGGGTLFPMFNLPQEAGGGDGNGEGICPGKH